MEQSRKDILNRAKRQAEELIKESNKRIENAIKEIREKQAEKEETKRIRQELAQYEAGLMDEDKLKPSDKSNKNKLKNGGLLSDEDFQKKVDKIKNRKEKHEQHLKTKAEKQQAAAEALKNAVRKQQSGGVIMTGDSVRIKGLTSVGKVEAIDGNRLQSSLVVCEQRCLSVDWSVLMALPYNRNRSNFRLITIVGRLVKPSISIVINSIRSLMCVV